MDEQSEKCPTCNNIVKNNWKYCRHCGEKVTKKTEMLNEESDISIFESSLPSIHEVSSEPEFDRDPITKYYLQEKGEVDFQRKRRS